MDFPKDLHPKVEINIVGWFGCFHARHTTRCLAVFRSEKVAWEWIASGNYPKESEWNVLPITAKVDFTFEQIQAELFKRVDKVQAVCFENPKL